MSTESGGNQHGRDGRFSDKPRKEPADTSLPNDSGTWPQGEALIGSLIDDGRLQQVDPDPEGAEMILDHAEGHLSSAMLVAESDPQGSIAMSYDSARKSMVAILLAQGLRATGGDTHRVTAEVLEAQLGRTAVVIDADVLQASPRPAVHQGRTMTKPTITAEDIEIADPIAFFPLAPGALFAL